MSTTHSQVRVQKCASVCHTIFYRSSALEFLLCHWRLDDKAMNDDTAGQLQKCRRNKLELQNNVHFAKHPGQVQQLDCAFFLNLLTTNREKQKKCADFVCKNINLFGSCFDKDTVLLFFKTRKCSTVKDTTMQQYSTSSTH